MATPRTNKSAPKAPKRTWVVVVLLLLLLVVLVLRGCASNNGDKETAAAVAPVSKVPAEVYTQKKWTGVVAPYANDSDLIYLDLNEGHRVNVVLSLIDVYRFCPGGGTPELPSSAAFGRTLRQLAPPGTRVVVVRQGQEKGESPSFGSSAQIAYIVDGNGRQSPISLNEQMVRAGAADVYPKIQFSTARFSGYELDYELQNLSVSPPDGVPESLFTDYQGILAAYREAWVNQTGETGVCARQYPEEAAARLAAEAERERAAAERANIPSTTDTTEDEESYGSTDSEQNNESGNSGSGSGNDGGNGICRRSSWC